MDSAKERQARFNPNRFTADDRKQVHWTSSRNTNTSPKTPPSRLESFYAPFRFLSSNFAQRTISWLPVVIIVSYLLVRDGWFTLFATYLSSHMVYIGLPARWFRSALTPSSISSSDVKQYLDDYMRLHVWGPPLRDFALASDGALVYEPYTFPPDDPLLPSFSRPGIALTDDNHIGHCWYIATAQGQLGITLPDLIFPTNVTIDYISRHSGADPSQAPRNLVLWGVVDGDGNRERYFQHLHDLHANQTVDRSSPIVKGKDDLFFVLAEFSFTSHGAGHIQTFPTRSIHREIGLYVGTVVLEVLDNWGAGSTCLYRVRIHGEATMGDA